MVCVPAALGVPQCCLVWSWLSSTRVMCGLNPPRMRGRVVAGLSDRPGELQGCHLYSRDCSRDTQPATDVFGPCPSLNLRGSNGGTVQCCSHIHACKPSKPVAGPPSHRTSPACQRCMPCVPCSVAFIAEQGSSGPSLEEGIAFVLPGGEVRQVLRKSHPLQHKHPLQGCLSVAACESEISYLPSCRACILQ